MILSVLEQPVSVTSLIARYNHLDSLLTDDLSDDDTYDVCEEIDQVEAALAAAPSTTQNEIYLKLCFCLRIDDRVKGKEGPTYDLLRSAIKDLAQAA